MKKYNRTSKRLAKIVRLRETIGQIALHVQAFQTVGFYLLNVGPICLQSESFHSILLLMMAVILGLTFSGLGFRIYIPNNLLRSETTHEQYSPI